MKDRIQKMLQPYGYFRVNVLAVILAVIILLGISYVWDDAELYYQTRNLREGFAERTRVSVIYGYEIEEKDKLDYENAVEANLIALEEGTELGRILAKNDRNNQEGRMSNDFILGGISALLLVMILIIFFNGISLILNIVRYFSRPKSYKEDEEDEEYEFDSESEEIIEDDENEESQKEVEIKIVETLDELFEEVDSENEDNEGVDEDEFEEEEEFEFEEIGYSSKDASKKKTFFGCTRLFGGRNTKKVSKEE